MKTRSVLNLLAILALTLVFSVPSCWAKEKGYCYVVGYSLRDKTVQMTPVIVANVSGDVYNAEEFVADVDVIFNMESQFQSYLDKAGLLSDDTTVEARVAYRTNAIARKRWIDEKDDFSHRGFNVNIANKFKYKP